MIKPIKSPPVIAKESGDIVKVYCNDCAYFSITGMHGDENCNNKKNQEISNDHRHRYNVQLKFPSEINENNDCKWYKRKWWLIWK